LLARLTYFGGEKLTGFESMMKKAAGKKGGAGLSGYVTQVEAARERGVEFHVINSWAHRGRVRTRGVYGRLLVHLGDVLAYDPTANKGGRPKSKDDGDGKRKGGKK